MARNMILPQIHVLGERALLCHLQAPALLSHQQRIWSLAAQAEHWPEISEVVPGMNNLMLMMQRPAADLACVSQRILDVWPTLGVTSVTGRDVEIPVVYGGKVGPDLDAVARHAGLSCDEVIRRHSEATYIVYFIGFMPGFAYLGGLDPQLTTPRHDVPRLSIPAGSVGIGGAQTGIYPISSPGGWQILGRTGMRLFDPRQCPSTLLQPGDRVHFSAERAA